MHTPAHVVQDMCTVDQLFGPVAHNAQAIVTLLVASLDSSAHGPEARNDYISTRRGQWLLKCVKDDFGHATYQTHTRHDPTLSPSSPQSHLT